MASRQEIQKWLAENAVPGIMKSNTRRSKFAKSLATYLQFWSDSEMEVFINEMRGLQLSKAEDRAIFCDLLFTWITEESHESSCT